MAGFVICHAFHSLEVVLVFLEILTNPGAFGMDMQERKRLETLEKRFEQIESMVEDMHRALFKAEPGKKLSTIERIAKLLEFGERGEWVVGWFIKVVLTLGALVVAWKTIIENMPNKGP